ncbi:hypothetical protein A2331_02240 [Candidatus Falkowbacteria bacterium RIFOXYB2_FULL_34_18]|uniref:Cell shape-determining protein MreC n=1 Tax=Candidatus Falkowbacteria bacterium RIFOXYD2_FULL_34_120 TaxID=1798007 RepID=A0A1F5TQJ3_9BACT|nr:MAG: hypothetical protein A2331_02240 [Candidatus Falkowbacteria bacterium RIFOXYB2_FULL_34_18]OGF29514.1 MAG: hypothetical protein A2500_02290 [Candidatus Falkowbacteria bacterium RIFOXYC12_FULL_34_55]OGF36876.1 MAG: hypothetical protein A2466_06680 [Candidatus Falkowbacteria bacterium RIFOXYC2_FULL_34_220]OGF39075.1 MAG: hypothetical protein A2515_04685 [Candidatus Falkowbacteria bacterium RIFOXYD12_FULL_34_57]OGF41272.1 MAG: hypothetical protein A2531_00205 [Candidatus Falkowbacteria bact
MLKIDKKNIFVYIAVVLLLVFLYFMGVVSPIENIFLKTLNPVLKSLYSLSTDLRLKYNEQADRGILLQEIKKLESEIIRLTEENAQYKTTEEENNSLREHLMFLNKAQHSYILSNVISRGDIGGANKQTQTITIDKGKNDGLYVDLAVVSSKGVIVGKIFDVKDSISKIYLTNSPKCKLAATIINEDRTSGVVEGELGLTIKMGFIPQDKIIHEKDVVITSGLEKFIPRGLIIGTIIDVNNESNELWQSAIVEPMVNVDELLVVSVLLPNLVESL